MESKTPQKKLDYLKQYYQLNCEILKQKNKERKLAKNVSEKIFCPCGGRYTIYHKSEHLLSKKHLAFSG